ncbi:MAG: SGNH/GDSL hydrolase family protein, partial [Acidobacteriota bacterium]
MQPSKSLSYYLPRLALAAATTILALLVFSLWWSAIRPEAMRYAALHLSDKERDKIYQEITNQSSALWDVSPEPWVGRLGKKGLVTTYGKEEVRFNNAGMRSSRDFGPKPGGKFRIVCLGDSFVFANAAVEQDRFCDQIEDFYNKEQLRVDGQEIEAYAVGLSGWTMVQEAAYLVHRLSEYQPDVIIVLSVGNDIGSSHGVTGGGMLTERFSPEERQVGSGVFFNNAALQFGVIGNGAISTDLTPEPRARWARGMGFLKRLVDQQQRRGGKILLSALEPSLKSIYFSELFKHYARQMGINAPLLATSFFGFRLPHDSHPDRTGHGILASHYIRMLDRLGWVKSKTLPELYEGLQVQTAQPDPERLKAFRRNYIDSVLRPRLEF